MKQFGKQFLMVLCVLQLLLAPEVCLMLCCQPIVAQVVHAEQSAKLAAPPAVSNAVPACHAKRHAQAVSPPTQASFPQTAKQSVEPAVTPAIGLQLHTPCPHPHEEKPVATVARQNHEAQHKHQHLLQPLQHWLPAALNWSASSAAYLLQPLFPSPPRPPGPRALRI